MQSFFTKVNSPLRMAESIVLTFQATCEVLNLSHVKLIFESSCLTTIEWTLLLEK